MTTTISFTNIKNIHVVGESGKIREVSYTDKNGKLKSVTLPTVRLIQLRLLAEMYACRDFFSTVVIGDVEFDLVRKPHKQLKAHKLMIEKIIRVFDLAILGKENAHLFTMEQAVVEKSIVYTNALFPEYRVVEKTVTGEIVVESISWRKVL